MALRKETRVDELAGFFDQSFDMLCIAGVDGFFYRLNPAWETVLGWTVEELKSKPFGDFVHPDDREATSTEVEKLRCGTPTILFENRYRARNGLYRRLQWNARLAPDDRQIYAAARDVTEQRRLEREILEIADQERERLGRDLHDGLCQTLAGIAALSKSLSRRLDSRTESAAAGSAAEISTLLHGAIEQARNMARGLSPLGLDKEGLRGMLDSMASNVAELFQVRCTFECSEYFPRLSREFEAHLFRIAQEAIRNAVTHGQARLIDLILKANDKEGRLWIQDDGSGIPEGADHHDGSGLRTMAYRSRLIGAVLTVRRRHQRGTSVECTFPLRLSRTPPEDLGS